MRVLMVHDEPIDGGYGAETYLRRLVEGLRGAGDDVEVVAGELRHSGLARARDVWDPAARRLVEERARGFAPEVIHFHNIARELSAAVLGAARHVPAVMTFHDFRLLGSHEHLVVSPRGAVERLVAGTVRRAARDRVAVAIGVSEVVSEALRSHGFGTVVTIGVPAPSPAVPPKPVAGCHDVVVVARLAPDKGADVVIDAFGIADIDGSRLLIAGDGPARAELERLAKPLGGRVSFLGRLDEAGVSDLLGRARVVVVASQPGRRREGSSLTTVEAAAHGRPVVGSDDPAIVELARTLGCVVTVPAQRASALAAELTTLLLDDRAAASLSWHANDAVQRKHSIAAVTEATQAVYRDAAGR
jgi:glycosyltransferase involved in cell wall biosynthesis